MKAISRKNSETGYSSGNLRKYQSANPLKRLLVKRMQNLILVLSQQYCGGSGRIRILDAGCGEGINAVRLEQRLPGAELFLLDASEKALDYARGLCSERCAFYCGSVTELPFPDRAFDLVLCTEVFEHLDQPEKAMAELLRVSSGHVILSVPHEPWFRIGNLLALQNVSRLGDPPDHKNHWTFGGFRRWVLRFSPGWRCEFYDSFPWTVVCLHRNQD